MSLRKSVQVLHQTCFQSHVRSRLFCLVFAFQFFGTHSAQAHVDAVVGDVDIRSNANLPGFLPATNEEEILISRKQYVISYNKTRREPNWVAWKVEKSDLGTTGRSNIFLVDPDLESYLSKIPGAAPAVDPTEYRDSCFDRGHQAPSGDRTSSPEDNRPTFVMSNMIPQTAYLNRVIWEHLEQHTRDLVTKENKIAYVIAGPIFDQDFGKIGPRKDIPVPSKNFKMILVLDAGQALTSITASTPVISVIMPNSLADGSPPTDRTTLCNFLQPAQVTYNDWEKYQTSVGEIERVSGITLH